MKKYNWLNLTKCLNIKVPCLDQSSQRVEHENMTNVIMLIVISSALH